MNKAEFNNIIEKINNTWLTNHIRTATKTLDSIYALAKDINNLDEVTNVEVGDGTQVNFSDFDNEPNFLLEYDLLIEINNIKINAKIRLIPAGDYGYNIVLCLKNDNHKILESLQLNENFSIKSFIKELKQCESFDEVKTVFKKYAVEAAVIGTLMTAVLCNFNLTDSLILELGNSWNVEPVKSFYIYDDETDEVKPEWSLLCDDTEVTVYHAKESQCNSDVLHTASMFKLNLQNPEAHKIIAMERSMMKLYGLHYGDLIKIEGTGSRDGIYQILDTMNKRFKGKHKIDILINYDSNIGKWNNIKIYKLLNPEYYYNEFKENMSNALNQKWINLRLNKY